MSLLGDIDAFYLEHRRCGVLEGDVCEEKILWVWMRCSCGGRFARAVTDPDETGCPRQ